MRANTIFNCFNSATGMRFVVLLFICFSTVACNQAGALKRNISFLESNSLVHDVVVTSTGLQYQVLRRGLGPKPTSNSKVTLHYIGEQIDGKVFDNSYERGAPPSFVLGGVIAGLVEGVQLMSIGSKYRFVVPAALGYGDRRAGEIKPNATLIYEVELLNVEEL